MKWYKFDKKVNQEMTDYQSVVDVDALWGDIEADVDAINTEKKKRRRFLFFWFLFGVLVAGSGLSYLVLNGNESADKISVVGEPFEQGDDLKGTTILNQGKGLAKGNPTSEDNGTFENNIKITKPKRSKEKSSTLETSTGPSINSRQKLEESNNIETKLENKTPQLSINDSNDISLTDSVVKRNSVASNVFTKNIDSSEPNNKVTAPASQIEEPINITNFNLNLNQITLQYLSQTELQGTEPNWKIKEVRRRNKRKFQLSFSLLSGVGFMDRKLSSESGDASQEEMKLRREKTEKTLETTQLGLQAHWKHKSGFELSSGINYTQINEKFEYLAEEETVETIEGIQFYYVNVNGDTIANRGDIPETTITTYNQRNFNKIRLIEIPVLASYSKQIRQFSFGVQTGVFVAIKTKASGKVYGLDQSGAIDYNEETYNNLKTDFNLSYHLGAVASYKISEHWSVSVSPFMRVFPDNFFERQYGIRQEYRLYGALVGLRYSL